MHWPTNTTHEQTYHRTTNYTSPDSYCTGVTVSTLIHYMSYTDLWAPPTNKHMHKLTYPYESIAFHQLTYTHYPRTNTSQNRDLRIPLFLPRSSNSIPKASTNQIINTTHEPAYCNATQHAATHCSTLQHTAAHCNTRQHTKPLSLRPLQSTSEPANVLWDLSRQRTRQKRRKQTLLLCHTIIWI